MPALIIAWKYELKDIWARVSSRISGRAGSSTRGLVDSEDKEPPQEEGEAKLVCGHWELRSNRQTRARRNRSRVQLKPRRSSSSRKSPAFPASCKNGIVRKSRATINSWFSNYKEIQSSFFSSLSNNNYENIILAYIRNWNSIHSRKTKRNEIAFIVPP